MNFLPPRSWIEIDLKKLESNVHNIKSALPKNCAYICVVKADAYGHCMPQSMLRFLSGGADYFAVANVYEASRVRELISDKPILVLSPILKIERNFVFDYDAIPAISTIEECEHFDALAKEHKEVLTVHIKVDTGMGRVGVWHQEAPEFIRKVMTFNNLKIGGIFTHLSCADCDKNYTFEQLENFKKSISEFDLSGMLIHAHNSAGIEFFEENSVFNAVRIGLLQYGILPCQDMQKVDVESVLSFKAIVSTVSEKNGKRIAAISAGYGDGVPADFTSNAFVLIGGKKCPIVGSVALDEMFADISAVKNVNVGDEVVFIGAQNDERIDLYSYSLWTRRIPWETMVSLPTRVRRNLIF